MSWKDDKDLGPWDFSKQPNKWGYLNNPRWSNSPEVPTTYTADNEPQVWNLEGDYRGAVSGKHSPCGHWHSVPANATPAPEIPEYGGFYIRLNSVNGYTELDYNLYTIRVTQPIETEINSGNSKGTYTEDYRILKYKYPDANGVVFFPYDELDYAIDEEYALNAWVNGSNFSYYTESWKGDVPKYAVNGDLVWYYPAFGDLADGSWDTLPYQFDDVWGVLYNEDLLEKEEEWFLTADGVMVLGWVIDITNVYAIEQDIRARRYGDEFPCLSGYYGEDYDYRDTTYLRYVDDLTPAFMTYPHFVPNAYCYAYGSNVVTVGLECWDACTCTGDSGQTYLEGTCTGLDDIFIVPYPVIFTCIYGLTGFNFTDGQTYERSAVDVTRICWCDPPGSKEYGVEYYWESEQYIKWTKHLLDVTLV